MAMCKARDQGPGVPQNALQLPEEQKSVDFLGLSGHLPARQEEEKAAESG